MNKFNDKGQKHGYWEQYYPNGKLFYKGNYINDKEDGDWETYRFNGNLWFKGNYYNGIVTGYWEWHVYFSNELINKEFYL